MRRLIALAVLLAAAPVAAQAPAARDIQAEVTALDDETSCFVAPGPGDGETRAICVWRPRTAGAEILPVLYMADGMDGIHVTLLDLKDKIEAGVVRPMMVVATDPKLKPRERASEYVRGIAGGSGALFETHERWIIDFVIPWAERTQRAAPDRDRRYIGGFSNGADLALALALRHPDVFAGALIHSPVGADAAWVDAGAAGLRWVVTGGTRETRGSLDQGGALPRRIAQGLARTGGPVRVCIGPWEHQGRIWRQLTPGSLTWLMGLGDPLAAETDFERGKCETAP